FVVTLAWLLALKAPGDPLQVVPISAAALLLIAGRLMRQPASGQTVLFGAIWMALLMLSGVSVRWIGGLVGGGFAAIVGAYLFYPVATQRINNFLFSEGDTYQVDSAYATLTGGGLFGTGPGGGVAKYRL